MLVYSSKPGTSYHSLSVIAKVPPLFDFHVYPPSVPDVMLFDNALHRVSHSCMFTSSASSEEPSLPHMFYFLTLSALITLARKFHCIFLFEVTVFQYVSILKFFLSIFLIQIGFFLCRPISRTFCGNKGDKRQRKAGLKMLQESHQFLHLLLLCRIPIIDLSIK